MSAGRHLGSEVSAPGKAFVLGEFAALEGAPALVVAVDRHVRVEAQSRPKGGWHVRLDGGTPREVALDELLEAEARGDLVAAVVRTLADDGVPLPDDVLVASDRDGLVTPDGRSLGLGSSAASSVALVAALAPELGRDQREALALRAHRAFQGGRGSGYDVVVSHRGGLCVVFLYDGQPRAARVELGPWALLLATGGVEVATVAVVTAVEEAVARRQAARAALNRLRDLTERGCALARSGRVAGLPAVMREFLQAERRLGEEAGVPVVPDDVLRLDHLLGVIGGACKPSGAGGDELIVGLVPGEEVGRARAFAERVGYEVLEARVDPHGLRVFRP